MSTMELTVDREQILAIVRDVFAAMIDGGEARVSERFGPVHEPVNPLSSWIDMRMGGLGIGARTVIRTERSVADVLTRALLQMDPGEFVGPDDLIDAFGELTNVIGGNLKSLLVAPAALTLPMVSGAPPAMNEDQFLQDLPVDWRGFTLVVSLWSLD